MTPNQSRKQLTTAEINDLPDSDFAYIEAGGEKDDGGKTVPRTLRHYPIPDAAHVRDALARAAAAIAGDDETAKGIAEKALPAIKAAAKKFEIDTAEPEAKAAIWDAEHRDSDMSYGDLNSLLGSAVQSEYCLGDQYSWVCDFTDEYVIFSVEGETFQVDYTLDGRTVTFVDKPVAVTPTTSWIPMDVESKSAPTKQDSKVMAALIAAKAAIDSAKAAQLKDPDNKTDPDDVKVMAHIGIIESALTQALAAQSVDGNDDPEKKSAKIPAVPKRSFVSLTERAIPNVTSFRFDADQATDTAGGVPFTGYASTTGNGYAVRDWLGAYDETIAPGAFAKTLREQTDIPLLQNHDPNLVLANTGSSTSSLAEDKSGLRNDALINPEYRQLITGMRRQDITKMSFSFRAIVDDWNDSYEARTVRELALYDTSIVTYPANPSTSAELLDEFRSVMGREGLALAWSARSAIQSAHASGIDPAAEPIFESVIRALALSDEALCRRSTSYALQGRARTFMVAGALNEVRAGRKLSSANTALLNTALTALNGAADAHQQVTAAHAQAAAAVSNVLASTKPTSAEEDDGQIPTGDAGLDADAGGGQESSITPGDGLGPRSIEIPAAVRKARMELELMKLRRP